MGYDHERFRKFGGFNDFPPNWKPIEEEDFWNIFMVWASSAEESRQMYDKGKKGMPVEARLFFYNDDTGVALVKNYDRSKHRYVRPSFYQFAACEHEYDIPVPEKSRMCYTVTKCSKCGRERHVDSSG